MKIKISSIIFSYIHKYINILLLPSVLILDLLLLQLLRWSENLKRTHELLIYSHHGSFLKNQII
jgi:hypothetical protein